MLYGDPCVYVVGCEYQIVLNTLESGIVWLEIGGTVYRDSECGLVPSETLVHKIAVPMAALNEAKRYRVCFRSLPERKPYFPELGDLQTRDYAFRPVDGTKGLRVCMLADTHSHVEEPIWAAAAGGEMDLLVMNGDIPAESKSPEDIRAIFDLTSRVAGGQIPVVFARGNHDYRGRVANELTKYIGTDRGNTWFTFRLGGLWGIVLDAGEDKDDLHPAYGGLIDCHSMRLRETEFLKDVVARAEEEFLAPDVTARIAICHVPFASRFSELGHEEFDIEKPVFAEWTALCNRMRLDLMIAGHTHTLHVIRPEDELARMGCNFPVVVGSAVLRGPRMGRYPQHAEATYIATAFTFTEGGIDVRTIADDGTAAPMVSLPL